MRIILQVRPKTEIPIWWPKDEKNEVAWVTVDPEGGYVTGLDINKSFPESKLEDIKKDWRANNIRRQWEYKVHGKMKLK